MAIKRKGSFKKLYIAIFLIVLLIVAIAAIVYVTLPRAKEATVGVHVGDSFTYSLMGISSLESPEAVETPGFGQYNQTDYYKITITGVNGTTVSLDTSWRFLNGTEVNGKQTIDLSNGQQSVTNGFWAIYSSNLNVNDLIRPAVNDPPLNVNQTKTNTYADSSRETNFWFIQSEFFDVNDPTRNTRRFDYTGVYFDRQTGMLESLNNISAYNNPLKTEAITWKLVSCTVWNV
ncbi:MAG: hypothetical protein M1490_02280 [Candidatus Bathyarchaeota archaeon]|nr:hypothetical protein [Candidatus Bathyarchaeota archaeon]